MKVSLIVCCFCALATDSWKECKIPHRHRRLNEGKRYTPASRAGTSSSNSAVGLLIKRGQCCLYVPTCVFTEARVCVHVFFVYLVKELQLH